MKKLGVLSIYLILVGWKYSAAQGVLDNTQVRFFANTDYFLEKDSANKTTSTFNLGKLEMLLTSQISDKISLLAEPIFSETGFSLARVMITYAVKDNLKLSAGKLYTPIGLWNTTFYHNVKLLTPTINQPAIISEPDESGVLDNKDTGLQLSGENISKARIGYKFLVGNGYSTTKTSDITTTYNVFVEPIDNFKIGVSGRLDNLSAGSLTPRGDFLTENTMLNLMNASIMYYGGGNKFEFASEFYKISTKQTTAGTGNISAYFIYAGYKIAKNLTPYVLYNKLNYDSNISWFNINNYTGSTIGVRYNFGALSVLKLEAQFLDADQFKKLNRFGLQWAIGF